MKAALEISTPPGMPSDGCTIWRPVKRMLGGDKYVDYCREHDFLRRYAVVHWLKANWILACRIWSDGLAGKIHSPFYLLFTTVSYPFFRKTLDLPPDWQQYADNYQ